jgi:hypothetical protein
VPALTKYVIFNPFSSRVCAVSSISDLGYRDPLRLAPGLLRASALLVSAA